MGILNTHGFDQCTPPVCAEDIVITVTSVICTGDDIVHAEWTVSDRHNRTLNLNSVEWSCDNQNFNNTAYPENDTQPYKTSFNVSSCSGVIWLRVKIRIGTSIFKGDTENISVSECVAAEDFAVKANWCGDCPDTIGSPPAYVLYARSSSIPSFPVHFTYAGLCWNINNSNSEILIADLPIGSILTDVSNTYSSCNDCCLQKDCPKGWEDPGDGDLVGTFYFEYQTYFIKDRLYVLKNF